MTAPPPPGRARQQESVKTMNKTAKQYFLTQASTWLDLYGAYFCDNSMLLHSIDTSVKRLTKDLGRCQNLLRSLALYTGRLWKTDPAVFTTGACDLVAPPDSIINLDGVEYDKAAMEILIDRCARQPRWEDVNYAFNWHPMHDGFFDQLESLYGPDNSDEVIFDGFTVWFGALLYETEPDAITALLAVLLTDAWECYVRAWERVVANQNPPGGNHDHLVGIRG